MQVVCVLDMDHTLGCMTKNGFIIRPFANLLVQCLVLANVDIILWSAGADEYVKFQVNVTLPFIKKHAKYIFARTVCEDSIKQSGIQKSSIFIRNLYENQDICLIGIDDNANVVMDNNYNLRIRVESFCKNSEDSELMKVLEQIFEYLNID